MSSTVTFHSEPSRFSATKAASTDWDFYRRLANICDEELRVVRFQNIEYPVFIKGDYARFGTKIPMLYSTPFTLEPHDLRTMMIATSESTGKASITCEPDWSIPNELRDTESLHTDCIAFELPSSWDVYLASLSKKARYDVKNTSEKCQTLHTEEHLPTFGQMGEVFEAYRTRCIEKFEYPPDRFDMAFWSMISLIHTMERIGTLYVLTIRDGDRIVGVNIAERLPTRSTVLDLVCLYVEDERPLGKFAVNQNILASIQAGYRWYDLGPTVPEEVGAETPLNYKRKWVPKTATLPQMRNFAVASDQKRAQDLSLFPPVYLLTLGRAVV